MSTKSIPLPKYFEHHPITIDTTLNTILCLTSDLWNILHYKLAQICMIFLLLFIDFFHNQISEESFLIFLTWKIYTAHIRCKWCFSNVLKNSDCDPDLWDHLSHHFCLKILYCFTIQMVLRMKLSRVVFKSYPWTILKMLIILFF